MANLLSISFKKTTDLPIRQATREYILNHRPDTHPDAFKWDISRWEALRNEGSVSGVVNADRLERIHQYHAQLVFVLTKLPVNMGLNVSYAPVFSPTAEPTILPNLEFERCCVLFNLAALQSQLAATEDRTSLSGLKRAIALYQAAAGTLSYLHTDALPKFKSTILLSEVPPDLTDPFLVSLELLMLAQGQECAWQQAISEGYKNGVIAKLAAKVSSHYGESLMRINGASLAMKRLLPVNWLQHLEAKQLHFAAVAQYRKSVDDLEYNRYGHEIARLSLARTDAKKAHDVARRGNVSASVLQDIKSLLEVVRKNLTRAERDNDLIYHKDVPTMSELPLIQEASIIKTLVSKKLLEPKSVIGNEPALFSELMGWGARMAIDIYKDRQNNWIKENVSNTAQELDDLVVETLRSVNLPGALDALERPIGLPPSLLKKAEEVRVENGPARVESSIDSVQKLAQRDKALLDAALDALDQEAEEDEAFRAETPTNRLPSQEANVELVAKAEKWRTILLQAADSDEVVRRKWDEWETNITELTWSEAELEASVPSSTVLVASRSGGPNITQIHARALRVQLETLDDLQRVRQGLVSRAQKLADADDITPRIMRAAAAFEQWIEVQPAMLDDVLEEELSKFDKFHEEIEAGRAKQEELLNSIKERNALFLKSRKEDPAVKDRERALQSLDLAYHKYKEITRNLDEGLKFYNDFGGMLSQFKETCRTWAQERRSEMISLTRSLEVTTLEDGAHAVVSRAEQKSTPLVPPKQVARDLPPPDSDEWETFTLPPAPLTSRKLSEFTKTR